MAHTPGPWIWGDDENLYPREPWLIYAAWRDSPESNPKYNENWIDQPQAIVQTDSGVYGPHGDDRGLIEAAPDMLAALKTAYVALSQTNVMANNPVAGARIEVMDAIEKAQGHPL